jgi:hypothetical protein
LENNIVYQIVYGCHGTEKSKNNTKQQSTEYKYILNVHENICPEHESTQRKKKSKLQQCVQNFCEAKELEMRFVGIQNLLIELQLFGNANRNGQSKDTERGIRIKI